MAASSLGTLVSTDWLAAHMGEPDLRVVDGSWHMPQARRDPRREFFESHVPGAVLFDIDAIADQTTALPHMLPSETDFARAVGALGIGEGDRVVVYDTRGVVSAARVWWTFRAFGHDAVAVLDGGFPKWRAEERPVASGAVEPTPRPFVAKLRPERVRTLEQVRAGHIPGSLNLPSDELYRPDATLLPSPRLRQAFEDAGLDLGRPVVTSCGSGVTASVLALALHLVGQDRVAVYDGSWSEWGGRADTPVEKS
jgi:thiosulfate/3-mercaptopyruvate sulfurtransferase